MLVIRMVAAQNYSYFAGARSHAMAHSSVAVTDIWSSFHNQAALGFLEKPSVGISYSQRYFQKDLSTAFLAYAHPTKFGTLGINATYFGFELANQSKIGFTYSKSFGKYFSAALQLNYQQFYISESSNNGGVVHIEAGILAQPIQKLRIGFHIFNPTGVKMPDGQQNINSLARLGMLYQFNDDVALTAEFRKDQDYNDRFAAGFEYQIIELLALRTGLAYRNQNAFYFGLGLNAADFELALAYEYASILGNNSTFSLQYQF